MNTFALGTETAGLDVETCRDLVASGDVGRLSWSQEDAGVAHVCVVPVNYSYLDGDIFFRSAPGAKLDAVHAGRMMSFEVDDLEPAVRTGWSVLGSGFAIEITDPAERQRFESLVEPWDDGPHVHVVRLHLDHVSGHRVPLHPGPVRTVRIDAVDNDNHV